MTELNQSDLARILSILEASTFRFRPTTASSSQVSSALRRDLAVIAKRVIHARLKRRDQTDLPASEEKTVLRRKAKVPSVGLAAKSVDKAPTNSSSLIM